MNPQKARILIIDDDKEFSEILVSYLKKYDFEAQAMNHPQKGLEKMSVFHPQLLILDIMMPDIDGLALCQEIRKSSDTPIIFLSARGDTTDRIVGLEMGADDYLPKPFEPRELVARINSILKRRSTSENSNPQKEDLKISEHHMMASLQGQELTLTATEFQALNYLYKNQNRIISRDELLTFLQGIDSEVFGRSIDILISRLRQKLNDNPKTPKFIKTIRSLGYRYVGGR